jgi:two-component system cell cycle sensor histidine kinase/response regulator CckA
MSAENPLLLAVDDREDNLFVIEQVLADHIPSCTIITALSAREALIIAKEQDLDGILADVNMPEMGGLELCRLLKAAPKTAPIPVVLMTAHKSASKQYSEGLAAGAEEFITKPIDNLELAARIRVMLRLKTTQDQLVDAHRELSRKENFELLNAVIEGTSDAIYVKDLKGRYLLANKTTLNLLDKEHDAVIGKTDHEILPSPIADKLLLTDRKAVAERQTIEVEESLSGDRENVWLVKKTPHFDETGTITSVVGISRDISAQRKHEKQQEKLESQMRQSQKMEAIGTMAGGITHHFNNILGAVMGFADMAKDELPKGDVARNYIEKVLLSANRAKELVKHIVTFSRQSDSNNEHHRADILLQESISVVEKTVPAAITLVKQIQPDIGIVNIRWSQFQNILTNLCSNAIDAMGDIGGELGITLQAAELSAGFLLGEENVSPGSFAKITVSDSGIGMTPEVVEHVFDPFYTTKEVGSGDGIGLSVVYGIVRKSGGFIRIESKKGDGSKFQVFLPLSTSAGRSEL